MVEFFVVCFTMYYVMSLGAGPCSNIPLNICLGYVPNWTFSLGSNLCDMYSSAHKSLTLDRQNSLTCNLLLTMCSVIVISSVHDPDSQVLHFLKTNTLLI